MVLYALYGFVKALWRSAVSILPRARWPKHCHDSFAPRQSLAGGEHHCHRQSEHKLTISCGSGYDWSWSPGVRALEKSCNVSGNSSGQKSHKHGWSTSTNSTNWQYLVAQDTAEADLLLGSEPWQEKSCKVRWNTKKPEWRTSSTKPKRCRRKLKQLKVNL